MLVITPETKKSEFFDSEVDITELKNWERYSYIISMLKIRNFYVMTFIGAQSNSKSVPHKIHVNGYQKLQKDQQKKNLNLID